MVIYVDTGDIAQIEKYCADERIGGATTNPSLARKVGITRYRDFANAAIRASNGKPISLEVLADDWPTMEAQARELAALAPNVWVKIPITNTKGESSRPLIEKLADLNLNITAVMTPQQMESVADILKPTDIISIFMGRIMDTLLMDYLFWYPKKKEPWTFDDQFEKRPCKLLWASTREVWNWGQASEHGFDIITMSPELIEKKHALYHKNHTQYSLETVRQFYEDGKGIEW